MLGLGRPMVPDVPGETFSKTETVKLLGLLNKNRQPSASPVRIKAALLRLSYMGVYENQGPKIMEFP